MNQVWLIGAGGMARDYSRVLAAQQVDHAIIGRGEASAEETEKKTGLPVVRGGLDQYLIRQPPVPEFAIVSVGVESLQPIAMQLLNFGVRNVLLEKPAGLNEGEMTKIRALARKKGAWVAVAYNRRFYASVAAARRMIEEDGGVTSFHFEFTEWRHQIEKLQKDKRIKRKWFLSNSTHVVDLAFFAGGEPETCQCYSSGRLAWHPSASVFCGAGTTGQGALFSYHANWEGPGRWGLELITRQHRLILCPLEKLQIQKHGSVTREFLEIDDQLDLEFKPGLYRQVQHFLKGETADFCSIDRQCERMKIYRRMANY